MELFVVKICPFKVLYCINSGIVDVDINLNYIHKFIIRPAENTGKQF